MTKILLGADADPRLVEEIRRAPRLKAVPISLEWMLLALCGATSREDIESLQPSAAPASVSLSSSGQSSIHNLYTRSFSSTVAACAYVNNTSENSTKVMSSEMHPDSDLSTAPVDCDSQVL